MAPLVGAHMPVPCLDGVERPYRDLDCAASTPALQSVADRVNEFLPLVLQRAPRCRLQVTPCHGRLRGGAGQRAPLRATTGRR